MKQNVIISYRLPFMRPNEVLKSTSFIDGDALYIAIKEGFWVNKSFAISGTRKYYVLPKNIISVHVTDN